MSEIKNKKYTYYLGVDISRNELDFAVMQGNILLFHREIGNNTGEIQTLINELKLLPKFTVSKAIFCMEQTGIYGNHLITVLKKIKANIVLENALHIRLSSGNIRGKNDKIDAIRIAQYACKNREQLRLYEPRRPIIEKLAHLSSLRNRMVGIQTAVITPIKEQTTFIKKGFHQQTANLCKASTEAIKTDLLNIDLCITEIIDSDERLTRLFQILKSIPGIGTITTVQIILSTNEFKSISNPKKFACYCGVAPFKNESGKIVGKAKVSTIANKKIKALLHTSALTSIRCSPEIKAYYERKTKVEGKPKMSAINAVRNKLILRIFACVNQDRLFEKEYIGPVKELPQLVEAEKE